MRYALDIMKYTLVSILLLKILLFILTFSPEKHIFYDIDIAFRDFYDMLCTFLYIAYPISEEKYVLYFRSLGTHNKRHIPSTFRCIFISFKLLLNDNILKFKTTRMRFLGSNKKKIVWGGEMEGGHNINTH